MSSSGKAAGAGDTGGRPVESKSRALRLARGHVGAAPGGPPVLWPRVGRLAQALGRARGRMAAGEAASLTSAAEWLLDNYYLVLQALARLRKDLTPALERPLPKVPSAGGTPRVYDLARELLPLADFVLDRARLGESVAAYQSVTPLTMAELWALPAVLRLVALEVLAEAARTVLDGVQDETNGQDLRGAEARAVREAEALVAGSISVLRAVDGTDWPAFFESACRAEAVLRRDPSREYARMDFDSRDRYRKVIEHLARATGRTEEDAAGQAVALARGGDAAGNDAIGQRARHVGYYLLGGGRPQLEGALDYAPPAGERLRRWARAHALALYLGSICAVSLAVLGAVIGLARASGAGGLQVAALAALWATLAVTVAVSVVDATALRLVRPRPLPKMDFEGGIPPDCRTVVAIPALVARAQDVDGLMEQLEQQYQSTLDASVRFALLTDLADAPAAHMPEDKVLVERLKDGVRELNRRHGSGRGTPFHLFHRDRAWNAAEGVWMGWERKRGKVVEFLEQLGRHPTSPHAPVHRASGAPLPHARYVIVLDADSVLTRGAAHRLVGTLAHPLNRPEIDTQTGAVTAGYTVLQPRVQVCPATVARTLLTRVYAGDVGLDPYSHAVSDVYQDLFGEGVFVGKGIVDVEAFLSSIAGRIPDNALLSHDLLEGLLGRAGLVTDVVVLEQFPTHFRALAERWLRWLRGDWQLLPWLGPTVPAEVGRRPNDLSLLDRWKVLDGLRRSLLAPAMLASLVAAWAWLPASAPGWTVLVVFVPGVVVLAGRAVGQRPSGIGPPWLVGHRPLWADAARWLLALAFLAADAWWALAGAARTLARLLVTHRGLLEWTPSDLGQRTPSSGAFQLWRQMAASPLTAVVTGALLAARRPAAGMVAAPLLVAWLVAPQVAAWLGRPLTPRRRRLAPGDERQLRLLARQTWLYYERFVGPDDHWLPPDHYQEAPRDAVAHRTSPSNIGFLLASCVAAADLGYVGPMGLALRLGSALATLETLERYRGHFLNWYDTTSLAPLAPRYVSTVDSGNLGACLIVVARACLEMPQQPVLSRQRWQGLLDTLDLLGEALAATGASAAAGALEGELQRLADVVSRVVARPEARARLLEDLSGGGLDQLDRLLLELVSARPQMLPSPALNRLALGSERVRHHVGDMRRDLDLLLPWVLAMERPPARLAGPDAAKDLSSAWRRLRSALEADPRLGDVPAVCSAGEEVLAELEGLLAGRGKSPHPGAGAEDLHDALTWCSKVRDGLGSARTGAQDLMAQFRDLAARADVLVNNMDFASLFDGERQVFRLGYNVDAAKPDDNHYDLLASEARLASLVAIAKRDVPQSHWLHLGRPVARLDHSFALLSWGGTMFEHLMPPLLLATYPGTLLEQSCRAAVQCQEDYARRKGVPWGISESGYYAFDANQEYQYRAFGVPELALGRITGDDLVVAPYASIMAVALFPGAVLRNLGRLRRLDMTGQFGFYEAVDFTPSRLPLGQTYVRVQSYMCHHQGMSLLALANCLQGGSLVRRFHSDPRIRSVQLLLQEQVPPSLPAIELGLPAAAPDQPRPRQVTLAPWTLPARTATPRVHYLSNGHYGVMLSNAGGGYSAWNARELTRWRADTTLDDWGTWIYIKDRDAGTLWSAALQPVASEGDEHVRFYPHKAEFHRHWDGLESRMDVAVAVDDVEVRLLVLTNDTDRKRSLTVASYGEVVMAPHEEDARHPAFNKLFIESEFLPDLDALVFRRRPRSAQEEPVFLLHMLVTDSGTGGPVAFETDRNVFLGRHGSSRSPAALLADPPWLGGTTGATLDPVMALGLDLEVPPQSTARLAFVTAVAESRAAVVELAHRYRALSAVDGAFARARAEVEQEFVDNELAPKDWRTFDMVLADLLYPSETLRVDAPTLAANSRGQRTLWAYAISGDFPIVLVRTEGEAETALVRDVLRAHAYWRRRGVKVDLVILITKETTYGQELQGELHRLLVQMQSDKLLNERGGVFLVTADKMPEADRVLLETCARVVLDGWRGSLADQVAGRRDEPVRLPALSAPSDRTEDVAPTPPLERPTDLLFDNGLGGFSPDGTEYVVYLAPGQHTPRPWINVIANPGFGCMVSESGAGCTWAGNSSENRLTPWANDPVRDPPGEALYLRDEESAAVWSPTPMPAPADAPYLVRHGAGYTAFRHHSHGLGQELHVFVAPDAPVKVISLTLANLWPRSRRVTATYYAEWALAVGREAGAPYVVSEYEPQASALLATNPYNTEFAGRVAFLAASQRPHGFTADRTEFIGRMGHLRYPAALARVGLDGVARAGLDPCAAIQLDLVLAPEETKVVCFALGQGADRAEALKLAARFADAAAVDDALQAARDRWDELLGAVTVTTPDAALDLLVNRWLLYQAVSCRLWGRTALYQSSGAYGFRDQLQDVMALVHTAPQATRSHLLVAAGRQFEAGDVLHWWHPPSGRGVRTRCSDDLLWLPYVTAHYVEATGDRAVLDEDVPFLAGDPLGADEAERYSVYDTAPETATLYEHCRRAVEKGYTSGPHGLPLIGSGDWNDGFNRVGLGGQGESVWLGWFLHATLTRFAEMARWAGRGEDGAKCLERAATLRAALEDSGWDGGWYRRAYYDDGEPLGSVSNQEWQIDSIAQSWAVMSGAADGARARQAMQAVHDRLVDNENGLVLLSAPPFDKADRDPGYIKGYPPGVRENGGVYVHAAVWAVWAFAEMDQVAEAYRLLDMLQPIGRSADAAGARRYGVEPYVTSGDIGGIPPRAGRGGWSWYSGSAGWMYRLALERLLGLRRSGHTLRMAPCIPPSWPGYKVRYRFGRSLYNIEVRNPDGVSSGVRELELDGAAQTDCTLTLRDDGAEHQVTALLGSGATGIK